MKYFSYAKHFELITSSVLLNLLLLYNRNEATVMKLRFKDGSSSYSSVSLTFFVQEISNQSDIDYSIALCIDCRLFL